MHDILWIILILIITFFVYNKTVSNDSLPEGEQDDD